MRTVIQLVTYGKVEVNGQEIASIKRGIVALLGFEKTDTLQVADKLLTRLLNYRIFPDEAGKMNLSLIDTKSELLIVPQFTLVAETNKGTRPGFSIGMPPTEAIKFFDEVVALGLSKYSHIKSGVFGADMQVSLCNDGPVTFIFDISSA